MKNNLIKFSLLSVLTLVLFILPKNVFAQTQSTLFDLTKTVNAQTLSFNNVDQFVQIYPFTTITIPAGSFNKTVNVYVYKGNFDAIKNAILPNLSPVSSYYLIFSDGSNHNIYPKNPLKVMSTNNFKNTDTYLYVLNSPNNGITSKPQQFKGHITINQNLPLNYTGFIVAANINIKKDNSALNVIPNIKTNAQKSDAAENKQGAILANLSVFLPIVLALVVVVILIIIIFMIRKKSKRTILK